MSFDVVAWVGAALAAMTLALRVPARKRGGWAMVAGLAAVAAGATACLAGELAVLIPAWLATSVAVSARDRPTDLRMGVGVLGDALAVAAFAGVLVDAGDASFPWVAGGPAIPDWAPLLLGLGIALRAGVSGMREPGLLIVACIVGARALRSGAVGIDPSVMVALGPLAALVAWAEGPLAALPILGASLFGVGDPVAVEAGTLVLTGAAVAIAGVAVAGTPAIGSRWRLTLTEGPPGGVTAAGLALVALVPAATGLVQVPLARAPEASLGMAAVLAVLGAAGAAAGARRLRSEAFSARFAGTVVAAAVLIAAVMAPSDAAELLDVGGAHGSVIAGALARTRGGLLGAGAFAAVLTTLLVLASRPTGRAKLQSRSSRSSTG